MLYSTIRPIGRIVLYVGGFVAAVTTVDRDAHCEHAAKVAILFREHGAPKIMEC